jgi:hypothetical protein
MKWLIEKWTDKPEYTKFLDCIPKEDDLRVVEYLLQENKSLDGIEYKDTDEVFFFGSINLAVEFKKKFPNIEHGVVGNRSDFEYSNFYKLFGMDGLNWDYFLTEIKHLASLYIQYGQEFLVRPNGGTKSFIGGIFEKHEISSIKGYYG